MQQVWRAVLAVCLLSPLQAGTVLVMPFFNRAQAPGLDWIGESVAETVRESLVSQGVLAVSREDRLEAYQRLSLRAGATLTRASILKAAQTVDATRVVYGHFELTPAATPPAPGAGPGSGLHAGATVRITARVLDLEKYQQGPEFVEVGAFEDLSALQTHLGWQSLQFLAPEVAPSEEAFKKERPPVRIDAAESYIRGLLAASPEQKHRLFTQAARTDPRFSQPCYQLGRMHWEQKAYDVAVGWLERVTRADSHYFEARFLLGLSQFSLGQYAAAESNFRLVAASAPLNEVWNNLGAAQSRQNQPLALESFRKAIEGDDTDPDYHFNIGYALWRAGQFPQAADSFRATLDRNSADSEATLFLGRCLKGDGPRKGDPRSLGRERIKIAFEVEGYRQLQAELLGKKAQ